jgi:hypothetical protein
MATNSLNGFLTVQDPPATPRPAPPTPRAPRTTSQDAQAPTDKGFAEQIRQEVQAEIDAATQAVHATPTPHPEAREFIIRGPDGRQTVVGMPPPGEIIPPQAVDIAFGFFWMVAAIIIGLPIARAFARRMDRKGGVAQVPTEVSTQLAHLNQAVDAIALEVERISEGQRFTTRLLSEQRDAAGQTLPSGAGR